MKKVIIIGAGLGGLVAGNLLVKKGHEVTIFESHTMPGGYVAGFHRKGFYFESGTLSLEGMPTVIKVMEDLGLSGRVEFVRQKLRMVANEFDAVPECLDDFKKLMYDAFPEEKSSMDAYFSEVDGMCKAMKPSGKPMPFVYDELKQAAEMASLIASGMGFLKVMKKYEGVTVSEFTERFFKKGSRAYLILNRVGYPDMPAWLLGMAMTSFYTDYWTVKNGMQYWSDRLAERFKIQGGKLRLGMNVDLIITHNEKALGVSANGEDYYADYVISASDYKKTFLTLLDNKSLIPPQSLEKIKNAAVSEGVFTVYLGLNIPNEELGQIMKVPHVLVYDESPDCDIYNPNDGDYFEKVAISLYSLSLVNPAHAPDGKSSLMIQALCPHKWMENWGGGDRKRYLELKNKVKETLIRKASAIIPDLREKIEISDAATPLTYEKFTRNTDGATSAWSWNPKKKFYDSIFKTNVRTPVKNLFIGSCWASQLGGIPGALGAAYECVKLIK